LRGLLARARRAAWIEEEPDQVRLSEAGLRRAAEVVRAERLWRHYLQSDAGIDRDLIDPSAEWVERILPPEVVRRLEAELETENRLPPIPGVHSTGADGERR
ncbi:MAG: iron dependent repressor, metal binding and dimerization domain protein, partial [Planctomycetota bacterium]